MYVTARFTLSEYIKQTLRDIRPPFGYNGFGEFVFYRTYSRIKADGGQENWHDCIIRVIEGVFSIRKDWYVKNHITWDEDFWQEYAKDFAVSMCLMEWLPPGRGLWAMGTDFIYERGSMALQNCGAATLGFDFGRDMEWLMDALMMGVGVGFEPVRDDKLRLYRPVGEFDYIIPDTREGWAESERLIIDCYIKPGLKKPRFIYDEIRGPGIPIKGFGGLSSGPQPLMDLHTRTEQQFEIFNSRPEYDSVYLKTNLANLTGICVIAGNVRRCFPGNVQLRTQRGLISIEKVEVGTKVETLNGLKTITNKFVQGEQKLVEVVLSNNQVIRCTPNHKFAVLDSIDGDIDWVEARLLSSEDRVLFNHTSGLGNNDFDIKEAYFYGVLNGDGNVYINKTHYGTISIACSNDENGRQIAHKVDEYLYTLGINSKDYVKEGYFHLRIYNADFAKQMLPYKIPKEAPVIPEKIYTASAELKLAYLAGLSDADGTPFKYNMCSSVHYSFLLEVQKIAASVGICTWISTRTRDWDYAQENMLYVKGYSSKQKLYKDLNPYCVRKYPEKFEAKWDCSISLSLVDRAKDEGNINNKEYHVLKNCTHKQLLDYNGNFWNKVIPLQVVAINELDYKEQTYDIEVEDDHCYFAENILVHNSAELAKGKVTDRIFKDLKDLKKFPERESFMHMSNNSVELETDEDFQMLGEIAQRVIENGEPGYINRRNLLFGRIGKSMEGLRIDPATLLNPCAEIPLEDKELCNLSETFPTMCPNVDQWYKACEYACFYSSTISLLPTHQPVTNRVIARNRRIGVGLVDYTGWKLVHGVHKVTQWLRDGYNIVRETNARLNDEAGVPHAIRVTTVKPGGSVPKIPGRTSGVGHPTFDYTLRRVRVAKSSPVHEILEDANVPWEDEYYDPKTSVFEWPIRQGPAAPAETVSLWEQAFNLIVLQREWSDNAVSNTLYFRPAWALIENIDSNFRERMESYFGVAATYSILVSEREEYLVPDRYKAKIKRNSEGVKQIQIYEFDPNNEEKDIEPVLSAIAPLTKSVSLLPHSPKGAYRQMPEEGISEDEYYRRLSEISPIDWSILSGSDGLDEKFCSGPSCELPVNGM